MQKKTTKNPTDSSNNEDILKLVGIEIEDGKIEINTNKIKSFLTQIEQKAQTNIKKLEEDVKKGTINLKDSIGIKVDENKIELDLNKTKSFFSELVLKLQNSIKEIEEIATNLKNNKK